MIKQLSMQISVRLSRPPCRQASRPTALRKVMKGLARVVQCYVISLAQRETGAMPFAFYLRHFRQSGRENFKHLIKHLFAQHALKECAVIISIRLPQV